jgi:hypothetical protein
MGQPSYKYHLLLFVLLGANDSPAPNIAIRMTCLLYSISMPPLMHLHLSTPACTQAQAGEAVLRRCSLRRYTAAPSAQVVSKRLGSVQLQGPCQVSLHQCYVEVGSGAGQVPCSLTPPYMGFMSGISVSRQ